MPPEAVLGFDVGTTSVKAGLLWLGNDRPMDAARHPYATERPRAGWAQQDPRAWLAAMAACWAELEERAGPARLLSVGICSQVNTHVLVGAALEPLHAAITWQDIRSGPEAAELDARVAGRRGELWGGPFTVDASFSLARAAWLARHEPAAWKAARWIMSPKDFCVAALSGEVMTDTISPIGLVGPDGAYVEAVLELVPGVGRLLPPLRRFDEAVGAVLERNPVGLPAGVPLAVGTMDAWANVYGSGVVRPGQAMEVAGTSEILAVLSDRSIPTRGVISFAPVDGLHLHAGPTQSGGDALGWAAACFGLSVPELLARAAGARQDPQDILFLPHLAGERAPVWNADARGVFIGLSTSTELQHIAAAVLEGVAFSARHALEECQEAAGRPAAEIRLSGGAARSALWNQVKASVHARPLHVLRSLDSAVLGAALMGIVAAGIEQDLRAAAGRHVRVAGVVDPEPGEVARLDELYGAYRAAYEALVPVFSTLARRSQGPLADRPGLNSDTMDQDYAAGAMRRAEPQGE